MTPISCKEPKGSEMVLRPWLEHFGVVDLEYVGDGNGPPDYIGQHQNEPIAIEILRLFPSDGWTLEKELGFARELRTLVAEVYRENPNGPGWHVRCEYDPTQACPSRKSTEWKVEARRALSTPGHGGTYQLIPSNMLKGYGIELHLHQVPMVDAFGHLREHDSGLVSSTSGGAPVEELLSNLPRVISDKSRKMRSRTRCLSHDQWWLVLDDDILIAPASILSDNERALVSRQVAQCPDIGLWSKVVLCNRRQPTAPPDPPPYWHWTIWDSSNHPPLPTGP